MGRRLWQVVPGGTCNPHSDHAHVRHSNAVFMSAAILLITESDRFPFFPCLYNLSSMFFVFRSSCCRVSGLDMYHMQAPVICIVLVLTCSAFDGIMFRRSAFRLTVGLSTLVLRPALSCGVSVS